MSTSAGQVPIERTEVSTRDQDEVSALIEQIYVRHQPYAEHGLAHAEFHARTARLGELGADRLRMTAPLETNTEGRGTLLGYYILSGTVRIGNGTEEAHAGHGDTLMYRRGIPLRSRSERLDLAMLRLPVDRAGAIAEQQTGIAAVDLRFESMLPVSTAMNRYFGSVIGLVHRELMADQPAMSNPLVCEQMVQTAAAATLATFPNTTMTVDHLRGPGHVAPAVLRRAIAYIDAHADQALTVGDIARAVGVGVRALQHAFRQRHETTPLGYLQQVRLARAHCELSDAIPGDGKTVAAVAARWGFAKPGRFAAKYREIYGQSPSHTLRI